MLELTVFTPTFNRGYILKQLYNSLCKQTIKDFEWLIVDDGSSDNTEEFVKSWIKEDKISIRYFKQKNGGKQRAHNKGVELSYADFFVCVDSDDYVTEKFVESQLKVLKTIKNRTEISGVASLQMHSDGKLISNEFPEGIKETALKDLYSKYPFKGDVTLVYKTELLKKYPFVVEEGEKFIGENYVYDQIDQKYKLVLLPEALLIKEYLSDGYTKNTRSLTKNNPKSYMRLKKQSIVFSDNLKNKFTSTILYEVGCILANQSMISDAPDKFLAVLAYLPAWLAWFIFYRKA